MPKKPQSGCLDFYSSRFIRASIGGPSLVGKWARAEMHALQKSFALT
jgi:hypothetical protein